MIRDLGPGEEAIIERQVLQKIKADKPDISEQEFQPIYDKMMADAIRLAKSLPPKATGGPVSRLIKGTWGQTGDVPLGLLGTVASSLADAPENLKREVAAGIESSKKGDFFGTMGHAISAVPVVGPTLRAVAQAGSSEFDKSREAFLQDGQEVPGAIHAALGTVPMAGPMLGAMYDRARSGDIAGASGEVIGMGLTDFIPHALPIIPARLLKNRNAEQAALMDRMVTERGYPGDLGTVTGLPLVKTVQRVGSEGLLGSIPTAIQIARDNRIYQYGDAAHGIPGAKGLADELQIQGPLPKGVVRPDTITPVAAGTTAKDMVLGKRDALRTAGKEAYADADMKAGMAEKEWVIVPEDLSPARQARIEHSLGRKVKPEEVQELRRILVEMQEQPYIERNWSPTEGRDRGNTASGQWNVTGGGAGASVFDDIAAGMPAQKLVDQASGKVSFVTPDPTRADVIASLKRALDSGNFTGPAKGAMKVVEERLANPQGDMARRAAFGPSAGIQTKEMLLPVDVTEAKDALRPEFDRMMEGVKSGAERADPALGALRTFMEGPDTVEALTLDKVLGSFKGLGRGGKEVRNVEALVKPSQRLAFQAQAAIEPLLQGKVSSVPGLSEALTEARGNWAEMYRANQDLKSLNKFQSAAGRFNKLSGPQGTEMLQQLQNSRPDAIPIIAKAKLDQINELAFSGKSGGPGQAFTEFSKIEPESLKILFPTAGHADQLRDLYQMMALRAENVNPSGSLLGATKVAEVVSALHGVMGKATEMLALNTATRGGYTSGAGMTAAAGSVFLGALGVAAHSPTVTRILMEGRKIPLGHTAAVQAWTRMLQKAVEEAQHSTNAPDKGGMSTAPFGQRDIELPAQGARDPRLPPPQ